MNNYNKLSVYEEIKSLLDINIQSIENCIHLQYNKIFSLLSSIIEYLEQNHNDKLSLSNEEVREDVRDILIIQEKFSRKYIEDILKQNLIQVLKEHKELFINTQDQDERNKIINKFIGDQQKIRN